MKILTAKEENELIEELTIALKGKIDGGRKNIICDCPYCNKAGKFGVYIGVPIGRKIKFASNCFKCGHGSRDLFGLLSYIGRPDLMPSDKADLESDFVPINLFANNDELIVDDELFVVELPDEYERVYEEDYLEERGFTEEDYEFFEVGVSDNFKFRGYVIFPIYDDGDIVGYVSRHTMDKKRLEKHNRLAKRNGKFQIPRYRNSTDNEFIKLLYNIDNVIAGVTETVILMEGITDVIGITRALNLYDNHRAVAVASFGKKFSPEQIYKLQQKGVKTLIIGYDPDAVATIRSVVQDASQYFDCFIADIPFEDKDFGDLEFWDVFDVFTKHLLTPREYALNKLSIQKLKI